MERKIAKITAVKSAETEKFSEREENSLPDHFFVFVDSKVLLTKNFKWSATLVNESVGFVKDIIYVKNETLANNMPMYVIKDFEYIYAGKPFFGYDSDK